MIENVPDHEFDYLKERNDATFQHGVAPADPKFIYFDFNKLDAPNCRKDVLFAIQTLMAAMMYSSITKEQVNKMHSDIMNGKVLFHRP